MTSYKVYFLTTVELNGKLITKIPGKSPNIWKQTIILINNSWIKEEFSRKVFYSAQTIIKNMIDWMA